MMDNHFYFGIDLDDENAVISIYQMNMKEPETLGTVAGSEIYQIPMVLTKKRGIGQWCIGEEAKRLAIFQEEEGVKNLLSKAIGRERVFVEGECYTAEELLALYLKKLMLLAGRLGKPVTPHVLVIALEKLSREVTTLFSSLATKLGLSEEQLMLVDRKECFYYFAYSQAEELALHDVCLYDCRGDRMRCLRLEKRPHTKPQLITLAEEEHQLSSTGRDEAFLRILQETLKGRIVSSVYLVGDGFEGDWMKQSVAFMCRGRRAFVGKNLYSKGACYVAAVREGKKDWQYVYLGDNELKVNVCLKVHNRENLEFYTLISAGENWYEASGECDVMLEGTPEIDFWLQLPNSREAKIEKLKLSDLPRRPERTTRLRILARPLSDRQIHILIKDLGFGELFPGTEKTWEYTMTL